MSQSNATKLQNIALYVASQHQQGLDLTRTAARTVFDTLPEGSVRPGERVLVVGAAEPHIARLAAQQAGTSGAVTVVDSEEKHLTPLRDADQTEPATTEAAALQLHQAGLDDLRTNPALLAAFLADHPVADLNAYYACQAALETQRAEQPLIATDSFDVVLLNQALHRTPKTAAKAVLAELFRVLRPGGRLVALLLLSDEAPPANLAARPGTSGLQYVPLEHEIGDLLLETGFYGVRYTWRAPIPMKVVAGVELRPFVIEASKDAGGPALDRGQAILYAGPWREVIDDNGQRYLRGERTAVSEQTYRRLTGRPYQDQCIGIPCYLEIVAEQAPPFDASTPRLRDPQVTKGKKTLFEVRTDACDPSSGTCC